MSSTSSSRLQRHVAAVLRTRLRSRLLLAHGDEDVALLVVPGRDLVAPPELARDAPGLDVLEPLEVGLLPVLGHELGLALRARPRAPARPAASRSHTIGRSDRARSPRPSGRRAAPCEYAARSATRSPRSSSMATTRLRASKRSRPSSASTRVEVVGCRQARAGSPRCRQAQAAPPVPRMLMSGSLWRSPTSKSLKSCAGVILTAPVPFSGSEYSSATIGMRRPTSGRIANLPTRSRIALVLGMHRHRHVAQHRLGPRRRNRDEAVGLALDGVADVPEVALHLDLLHLEVGDRRLELRVPVDEPLVLVDQALLVEVDEHLEHGAATGPRPW